MVEQILLSWTVRWGFCQGGTVGGSLNLTTFLTKPRAGMVAKVVEEGGELAGLGTGQLTGRPRAGGKAACMGSSKKAGFNRSTDIT